MIERTCKSCGKKFMVSEGGVIPEYCNPCLENISYDEKIIYKGVELESEEEDICLNDLIKQLKENNKKLYQENRSLSQDIINYIKINEDLKLKLKMIKKLMED
jgi:hypothetical protein